MPASSRSLTSALPIQGNVPAVIDGMESLHHIFNGQITLAHKAVADQTLFLNGILNMYIFNIGTKILHCLSRDSRQSGKDDAYPIKQRHCRWLPCPAVL